MTLLAEVAATLASARIPFAIAGAAALALHGASRSTFDVDLLAVDPRCLEHALWEGLRRSGARCDVRRGDAEDPLAGVVRIERGDERTVDVVLGRFAWQARILERSEPMPAVAGAPPLPVVAAADLVLLKLYAGGPQDAWDIRQLLSGEGGASIRASVESRLDELPAACRRLWNEVSAR